VVIPGYFERSDDGAANVNYTVAITPDGRVVDRYDKVRTVPFGEFVPLRGLIEAFSSEIPPREVRPGRDPAVLVTPAGVFGVSISWEIFFDHRARDAIGNGGEVLLNPTNGSSYWLTIVQSQQIAASRLRAIETDRWVLQVAPTGFSAVITSDGDVLDRTGISERRVIQAEVPLRQGLTLAVRWGAWPALLLSVALLAVAHAHRSHGV
jgi:apolipoprotein N-acyltransferase